VTPNKVFSGLFWKVFAIVTILLSLWMFRYETHPVPYPIQDFHFAYYRFDRWTGQMKVSSVLREMKRKQNTSKS